MTPAEELIENVLAHAVARDYDPVKRKEYYERTKKLKGRATRSPTVEDDKREIRANQASVQKKQAAQKAKILAQLDRKISRIEKVWLTALGLAIKIDVMPPGPAKTKLEQRSKPLIDRATVQAKKLEAEAKKLGVEKEFASRFRERMGFG